MSASRFELIVFDWDGTLMDSTIHIVRTINKTFAAFDLPLPSEEQSRYVIGMSLYDAMVYLLPDLPAHRYNELAEAYHRFYYAQEDDGELFSGVVSGLAALKSDGVILAVATGKSRSSLDKSLKNSHIEEFFSATRTASECAAKPAPEMLLSLMEQFCIDKEKTLMVGDSTHDLNMAKNAGVGAVAVSYGAHNVADLKSCQPLKIFDDFTQMKNWMLLI